MHFSKLQLPVVTTGNMHLHSAEGTITRYSQPTDIIADFFPLRLSFYAKRKASLLERAAADLLVLDNKVRFMACPAPRVHGKERSQTALSCI